VKLPEINIATEVLSHCEFLRVGRMRGAHIGRGARIGKRGLDFLVYYFGVPIAF
jgi:hypothetical protein